MSEFAYNGWLQLALRIVPLLVVFVVLPAVSYRVAKHKGRSAGVWALFVLLFPPLFLIILFINPVDRIIDRADKIQCPYCREWIYPDATLCRFCGKDLK